MFGAKPSFRISERELSYARAKALWEDKSLWHRQYPHANISDASPGRSHYWIEQRTARNPSTDVREECYSILMYSTYIHTWWSDNTYQSQYWNSAITRDVLSSFGPVRVWNDSRKPFYCKARFGNRANDFPYGDGITVDPEGWIRGLVDFKDVLRPGAKEERAAIRNQLRDNATCRIMLGEFGDCFAKYYPNLKKAFGRYDTGWMAMVPHIGDIAGLFYKNASHEEIEKALKYAAFAPGPCRATQDLAVRVAIDHLADQLLNRPEFRWYEKQAIRYDPINIRGDRDA